MKKFNEFIEQYKNENDSIEILNHYVESGDFIRDLKRLNDADLEGIAKRSTIHTNRFAKIVLTSHLGYKMRFHIWPVMEVNQYHEPHNHRWDFNSYVLTGTMVNRIVQENENNEKRFLHCKSLPMQVGKNREYQTLGPKGLERIEDQIIEQGNSYEMKHEIIHIAKIPKNTLTSTLFITSPAKKDYSDLYMPDLKNPPSDVKLPPFQPNELRKRIEEIVEVIER